MPWRTFSSLSEVYPTREELPRPVWDKPHIRPAGHTAHTAAAPVHDPAVPDLPHRGCGEHSRCYCTLSGTAYRLPADMGQMAVAHFALAHSVHIHSVHIHSVHNRFEHIRWKSADIEFPQSSAPQKHRHGAFPAHFSERKFPEPKFPEQELPELAPVQAHCEKSHPEYRPERECCFQTDPFY